MNTPTSPPPLPLHRMAVFTPGRQTDQEIKASFIARQAVLTLILEDIRDTRPGSIPQHHLIIGQRGMGKTTLLRRLHVGLREEPLSQFFIPLGFPEEQYSVDRLSTLFLNCLDALADTLEQENASVERITKIDEAVGRLRKDQSSEEIVAQDAERTLLAIAAEIGRRPVLLIDNLGLIFDRLKRHELNQLRAFLMKSSAPIIIGASSQVLDQDYAAPFYDHFKPHHLGRLSFNEMGEVLLRLAERSGNTEMPARLTQEQGRLHALHSLTGGNPRTTRILFDVFSHGFSQEAYQDLEMLLDWMTPLYKARFEEFSPQAQIVVSAIATLWEPVVISRICEETRLQSNQISSHLDRLKKADVIEEVTVDPADRTGPIPDHHTPKDRTGYQISERFFNIWFLMRQATRRDKRHLIYLTRFIECLHSTTEREQFAKDLIDQPALNKSQKIYALALEQSIQDRHLKLRLHDHVESEFIKDQRAKVEELEDIIDLAEIPKHRWEFAELRERLMKAVPRDCTILPEEFTELVLSSPLLLSRREEIAKKDLTSAEVIELMNEARANLSSLSEMFSQDIVDWFTVLLRSGVINDVKEPGHMSSLILRVNTEQKMEFCLLLGEAAKNLEKITELAFEAAKEYLAPNYESTDISRWLRWANICREQFKKPQESIKAFEKVLKLDSKNAEAWFRFAVLIDNNSAQPEKVLAAFQQVVNLSFEDSRFLAYVWTRIGIILLDKLGRTSEASHAFRSALKVDSSYSWAWYQMGCLQAEHLGHLREAEHSFRKAIKSEPQNDLYWFELGGILLLDPKRLGDAIKAYRTAHKIKPDSELYLTQLAAVLSSDVKKLAEVKRMLRKAISTHPSSIVLKKSLASCLELSSKTKSQAIDLWMDVLKQAPRDFSAWTALARFFAENENSKESLSCMKSAFMVADTQTIITLVRSSLLTKGGGKGANELIDSMSKLIPEEQHGLLDFDRAILAIQGENWGQAASYIQGLIGRLGGRSVFPKSDQDNWITLTAALLHYGYGDKLLDLLISLGIDQKLRPWTESIVAMLRGDKKYLRNAPVEVRDSAMMLFAQIQTELDLMPQETRRWNPPGISSTSSQSNKRK